MINVALEMLVKESLELPAFSTLDEIASRVRHEVNTGMCERINGRIGLPDRVGLESLLDVVGPAMKSPFNRLKQPAGKASWSGFREQVEHLRWVDSLGDTGVWLEGIAESKIADFAGEAMAADAAVMRDVAPLKRTALLACMVHVARRQARDDLAEMFCKRMASVTKLAKAELAELREREAEISEQLIMSYRSVLGCLDPRSTEIADASAALRRARRIVEDAGGFEAQLAEIEAVSAHHANNYICAARRLVVSPVQPGVIRRKLLGPMAYPDPRGERNKSMPGNRRSSPGVRGDASWDPRDMAKATLLKPQSPEDAMFRPPERHPTPAPCSATACM